MIPFLADADDATFLRGGHYARWGDEAPTGLMTMPVSLASWKLHEASARWHKSTAS